MKKTIKMLIEELIEKQATKKGKMLDEGVTIILKLTEEEREEFWEIDLDDNYVWEIDGNEVIITYRADGDILQDFQNLISEEYKLINMEKEIYRILEDYQVESYNRNSIFDSETEEYVKDGQFSYYFYKDKKNYDYNIEFKVLEESENNFDTLVKITDVYEI